MVSTTGKQADTIAEKRTGCGQDVDTIGQHLYEFLAIFRDFFVSGQVDTIGHHFSKLKVFFSTLHFLGATR